MKTKLLLAALLAAVSMPAHAATLITYLGTGTTVIKELQGPITKVTTRDITLTMKLIQGAPNCGVTECIADGYTVYGRSGNFGGDWTAIFLNFDTSLDFNGILPTDASLFTGGYAYAVTYPNGKLVQPGDVTLTNLLITTETVAEGDTSRTDVSFELGTIQSVSYIPEPASWALMIGGLAVVGASMRRRPKARFALA